MSRAGQVDGGEDGPRRSAAPGAAELLALAAAPDFVVMAIVTEVSSGGGMAMHGHIGHGAPFSEMTTMYLLMAVFHAPVWLRRMRAGV